VVVVDVGPVQVVEIRVDLVEEIVIIRVVQAVLLLHNQFLEVILLMEILEEVVQLVQEKVEVVRHKLGKVLEEVLAAVVVLARHLQNFLDQPFPPLFLHQFNQDGHPQ